ncbi:MAG: HNH/ENDO VII family nuclease [Gemmataceae bacterium]
MATKRPLNPDAAATADAKLAERTGGRKLTMGPEDAALREEWLSEYKKAAGEADDGPPQQEIKGTTLPCGLTVYRYVGRYAYADGTGVSGAKYVLKDMGDKVLAEGTTDGTGRFRKADVPTPYAFFEVQKDPTPTKYDIKPAKKPEPAAKSAAWLDDAWDWTVGTVQGDFNEDQSVSQIVVNMVLGLIPVVDQVLDARDLIANLYHLIEYYEGEADRTPEQIEKDNAEFFGMGREFGLWVNIVLTGIGCFPEIGSAAKGVIKTLFKKMKDILGPMTPEKLKQLFEAVAEVLNKYGKFNAKKWLKNEFKPKLGEMVEFAKALIRKAIEGLEEAFAKMTGSLSAVPKWLPGYDRAQQLLKRMEDWKAVLPKLKSKVDDMVQKVRKKIEELTDKILQNEKHASKGGVANGKDQVLKQGKAEPPSLDPPKRFWTKKKDFKGNRVYQRDDLIDPKLVDKKGRTNLDRMKKGLAPLGPDGKPINLHHMLQTQDGAIAEMTQTFHQQNHKVIHINPNTTPSGIDRKAFDAWKKAYWKNRANDFGG